MWFSLVSSSCLLVRFQLDGNLFLSKCKITPRLIKLAKKVDGTDFQSSDPAQVADGSREFIFIKETRDY